MSTMMWIKCLVIIGVLMICSYYDVKEKQVPLVVILLGIVAVTVLDIVAKDISIVSYFIGISLGMLLIFISRITKNAIGMGDAFLVVMVGMGSGIYQTALIVFYSLIISSVLSLILLTMKRIKRKSKIPFVPFLLLGYVGVILSWQI